MFVPLYIWGCFVPTHTHTNPLKQIAGQESGSPPPGGQGQARERSGPGAGAAAEGPKDSQGLRGNLVDLPWLGRCQFQSGLS